MIDILEELGNPTSDYNIYEWLEFINQMRGYMEWDWETMREHDVLQLDKEAKYYETGQRYEGTYCR